MITFDGGWSQAALQQPMNNNKTTLTRCSRGGRNERIVEPELHINTQTGQLGYYERSDPFKRDEWFPLADITKEDLAKHIQDLVWELDQARRVGPGKGSRR